MCSGYRCSANIRMGYGCSGYRCSGTSVRWGWEHLFGGRPPWGTDVRNGGSAEASVQVYIYYPLLRCVVLFERSGWCFGVFCDCGWSCDGLSGLPPHVLHMSVWVAGLVLVDTCRNVRLNADLSSRWMGVYPPFGVSSSARFSCWWVW